LSKEARVRRKMVLQEARVGARVVLATAPRGVPSQDRSPRIVSVVVRRRIWPQNANLMGYVTIARNRVTSKPCARRKITTTNLVRVAFVEDDSAMSVRASRVFDEEPLPVKMGTRRNGRIQSVDATNGRIQFVDATSRSSIPKHLKRLRTPRTSCGLRTKCQKKMSSAYVCFLC
jgi:hypothetical protein